MEKVKNFTAAMVFFMVMLWLLEGYICRGNVWLPW